MVSNDFVKGSMKYTLDNRPDYFQSIFEQRSVQSDKCAGSYYNMSPEAIMKACMEANWSDVSTEDNKAQNIRILETTDIAGNFAMFDVSTLPPYVRYKAIDPKGIGSHCFDIDETSLNGSEQINPTPVNNTRMVIKTDIEGSDIGRVLTMYPGPDINPNEVYVNMDSEPQENYTAIELGMMGIKSVKMSSKLIQMKSGISTAEGPKTGQY